MTGDPRDVRGAARSPGPPAAGSDVLEGGWEPPWWRRRWAALSPPARRAAVALLVLLVVGTAGLELRDRAAERARAERVDVAVSLGVWSSSTAPLGGQVSYFAVVRNDGPLAVRVTSVRGAADGLRLQARDGVDEPVPGRDESRIPLSIRLTCARYGGGEDLDVAITVRREDGGLVTRRVPLESADLVLGVASSMCSVLPDVDDRELSGPVLGAPVAGPLGRGGGTSGVG